MIIPSSQLTMIAVQRTLNAQDPNLHNPHLGSFSNHLSESMVKAQKLPIDTSRCLERPLAQRIKAIELIYAQTGLDRKYHALNVDQPLG